MWPWKMILAIAAIMLAGCQSKESTTERAIPSGWKSYTTLFGYTAYLIPTKIEDGTRCVLVMQESGNSVAISCDWSAQ